MIILGIETSCDETALSIIEANGGVESPSFKVLGNVVLSQAKLHEQYGGVFPNLARREHSRNLIPLFKKILEESNFRISKPQFQTPQENLEAKSQKLKAILEREPELLEQFLNFIPTIEKPPFDLIAVTQGPGLEPALWVGISFAKALGEAWDIPVFPVNHMEGHIVSVLLSQNLNEIPNTKSQITKKEELLKANSTQQKALSFPAIALLVSGGHTELVLIKQWGSYEKIGQTRDDAVGEAFDKVARILGLPYPGGPEISRLAQKARSLNLKAKSFSLPRPMIHSHDLDFSFSGLKTAVLYGVEKIKPLSEEVKEDFAREFEDSVVDVLLSKTKSAIEKYPTKHLIIAGGVSANQTIQKAFKEYCTGADITLHLPQKSLTGDNAVMIAMAGYIEHSLGKQKQNDNSFRASGNLSL